MLGKQISLAYPTLTRSDIERMVKKLEWFKDKNDEKVERLFVSKNVYFKAVEVLGDCRMVITDNDCDKLDSMAIVEDGVKDLEKQKQNANDFLVDIICSTLGVEENRKN